MGEALNVIALISGGKDSLYCILHCLENGHKIIALANLHPAGGAELAKIPSSKSEDESEDLNSFMYQTVGHGIIPLYSECLDLPLYRQEIMGKAVQTGRYYKPSTSNLDADETEDLRPLLQKVLEKFPEANAVCTGAILSTYQRTRFESVAVSLKLTPLAYLWQYPALPPPPGRDESLSGLLDDMAAAGCDARIVKIASGGIKEKLLWANVADPRSRMQLVSGLSPFFEDHEFWLRGAVLGEGGEYETMAVCGPSKLWKKRIEIRQDQILTYDAGAGVSCVRIGDAIVTDNSSDQNFVTSTVRIPDGLDAQFTKTLAQVQDDIREVHIAEDTVSGVPFRFDPSEWSTTGSITDKNLTVINSISGNKLFSASGTGDAADQMANIVKHIQAHISAINTTHLEFVSAVLLVKNMSDFAVINSTYSNLLNDYPHPNPPARLTIACPLPTGIDVCLSLICHTGAKGATRGLWVQSRSYWAPANIGPYSQAVCEPLETMRDASAINIHDAEIMEAVHVAGQIPLVPESMQMLQGSFVEQAVLSLQHLWRVGQERGVDMWPWGVAFVETSNFKLQRAFEACMVWKQAHLSSTRPRTRSSTVQGEDDDTEVPDAWDLAHNHFSHQRSKPPTVGSHLRVLPNPAVFSVGCDAPRYIPPLVVPTVVALPRSAPVEWWSLGLANLPRAPNPSTATTSTRHTSWGSISVVTIPHSSGDTSDETSQSKPLRRTSCFVTVQLLRDALISDPEGNLTSLVCDLDAFDTHASDTSGASGAGNPPTNVVIHGTAYLTQEVQNVWSVLKGQNVVSQMAIIPCNSLQAATFDKTTTLPGEAKASLAESESLHNLAMALTFRLDSTTP